MFQANSHRGHWFAIAILFEGGLGGLAALVGWAMGHPPWHRLDADGAGLAGGLFATLPMLWMLAAILWIPWRPFAQLADLATRLFADLFESFSTRQLAIVSLTAGFGEELFFRGLLQQAVADRWGWVPGLLVASAAFGLAHPVSKTYVALTAAAGLYLGWLLVATDNLFVPIVAHAVYDFVALAMIRRHAAHKKTGGLTRD